MSDSSDTKLQVYRDKRNFDVTSEPAPAPVKKRTGPLTFMVHKHHASRLHYDLRLELEGVLASWACPKGLSYDPAEKRLAVQTEDHPLEYGSFEGRIPDGEYGAGDSLIWDRGTWDTVPPGHGVGQLKKGHLHLKLEGEKLKGEWHLVRTHMPSQKDAWLVMKAKDGTERPGYDVEKERPESVKSGRTVTRGPVFKKQLRGVHPDPLTLLKRVWPPMLAVLSEEGDTDESYFYEVKYDGFRALAAISGSKVALQSRNELDFNERFPWAVEALHEVVVGEAVIDGELVNLNDEGVSQFQKLGAEGTHRFVAFDLLWLDGEDLRKRPVEERRELLGSLLANTPDTLMISERVEGDEAQAIAEAKKRGLEGVIAKKRGSVYEGKRSTAWRKLKTNASDEFVIVGYAPISNGKKQIGALFLGEQHEDGSVTFAGKVGTGFDGKTRASLYTLLTEAEVEHDPFKKHVRIRDARWVAPKHLAQIKYVERTSDGKLRHPVFLGLRDDKDVQPVEEEPAEEVAPKVALHEVATTHPNKLIFPKSKLTKVDVREYYDLVAPMLVKVLRDRPFSMQQWPQGIEGESFFRHDAGYAPEWIKRIPIEHDDRTVNHIRVDSPSVISWLANQSALTLHMMASRVPRFDEADWVVFDIDPADDDFSLVVKMAQTLKGLLDELKLKSYPKTSGKRGLHVLVPVADGHTHEMVTTFAVQVTETIAAQFSDVATTERMKNKRHGRLYLDAFQNGHLKTVVAPYSIRALEGAPVSTPLEWDEVNASLKPSAFTIKTMPARLKKVGDLFAPVLRGGQRLPVFSK